MKRSRKDAKPTFDLNRLAQDFQGLDANEPGNWPTAPRVAVFIALLVATVAAVWWFDWREQVELLERRQAEESQLRQDWASKKRQAINLNEYRQQLDETNRQFGALVKQLPNRADMDSLLAEINQAGLGRGLQFDLFKPGNDVVRDFYAEMPIDIRIVGAYHDLGEFVTDVARMSRIVTLSNISLSKQNDNNLVFDAKAITYRYLDEEELAQQRQQAQGAQGRR